MGTQRTPPLSLKKSREVYEEMARPPENTPQRRMVFERMREMIALRKRLDVQDAANAARR
ncbi:MAG TPA: hypothetical protein VEQ60_12190 [Longimicrobium sp.]|nr:hypothetical protein [Longimicrobium sp.]